MNLPLRTGEINGVEGLWDSMAGVCVVKFTGMANQTFHHCLKEIEWQ